MEGFIKLTKYLILTGATSITCATTAYCQDDVDMNAIREQLRKAKQEHAEEASTTKAKDYQELVDAEAQLLKKLEQSPETSSLTIKREIPKAEIKSNETQKQEIVSKDSNISDETDNIFETSSLKSNTEFQELEEKLDALKAKYAGKSTDYSKIKANNDSLKQKLNSSNSTVVTLRKELEEAKNRLLIAETEVERLSAVLEQKQAAKIEKGKPEQVISTASTGTKTELSKTTAREKYVNDMPIATVVVKKANIRTGPGVNNSPLMTVSRGTRLAVETRQGEWYRVIAPTGVRAWVNTQVIAFGEDYDSSPSKTVKIKGYNAEAEEG
ncbi:MAG: SH3 domain-containing protein [Bdellovibrionales bacterium]|nr:SH3 domain-containing protein [Bdellovibrionales bacterium]